MLSIAVVGMWHLGTVTAACLASAGHSVVGIDDASAAIQNLKSGQLPVAEPGLAELIGEQTAAGRLRFSSDFHDVAHADVVWVAWDTPVDDQDNADVEFVRSRALSLLTHMKRGATMVVSSQMPVGSVAGLEQEHRKSSGIAIEFACIPENLRLGKAIEIFLRPDRVVAGVRNDRTRAVISEVYEPFTDKIEWMSVESAEMTKHAINAFLATSICFINEIASLCELSGADALEVERGLKSDSRIGRGAYLHAGGAFAGGTLARDINFLRSLDLNSDGLPLVSGVHASNSKQKTWLERAITRAMGSLTGLKVGILGLAYKPGTNTLRRSSAVEAGVTLATKGCRVKAFDPEIGTLPPELSSFIELSPTLDAVLQDIDALVVMTPWPVFKTILPDAAPPFIFDPGRFLESALGGGHGRKYYTIGKTS